MPKLINVSGNVVAIHIDSFRKLTVCLLRCQTPRLNALPASLPNTPSQCLACFVAKHPLSMPYHLPILLFKKHQPASLPRLPLLVLLTSYHCKSGRKMVSTFYCIFREWITTVRKWSPNPLQEGFLLLSLFGLMGLAGVLRIFFCGLRPFSFFLCTGIPCFHWECCIPNTRNWHVTLSLFAA